jgi:XTP/dITP diphosphohydrolase
MEIVIASTNVHKIREYRSMLKGLAGFDVLSLLDFPHYLPDDEVGDSFENIAIMKALHAASALGRLVLADDSGLVVPALGGAPGIFSARYAGPHATDKDNRMKLLDNMKNIHDPDRYAYMECCIALADQHGLKKCVRGVTEGMIIHGERGGNGFGYDSVFLKHDYSKTFAELEEETKNRISHRRKAFDKLKLTLEAIAEHALLH